MKRSYITTSTVFRGWLAGAAAAAVLLASAGCSLDLRNPNAPSEDEVVRDPQGIMAVAAGMQGQFAESMDDWVVVDALVTDQWGTRSLALLSYISLFTGSDFDPSYGVVAAPWTRTYAVVRSANLVIASAEQLEPNMRVGVRSLSRTFKAMSLGFAIQQYERVPIDISVAGPVPQPRDAVLDTILMLLEEARQELGTVTTAQLTEFRNRVLAPGIDLGATIDAMLARYYLMDGQYQAAITAAERVQANAVSELRFPTSRNPINNLAFGLNYVGGLRTWADAAEPGDQRPGYWLNLDPTVANQPANPATFVLRPLRRYSGQNEPIPLFLYVEMLLIRAEAHARLGGAANILAAQDLVNQVRTSTTLVPPAGLPPKVLATQEALLDAIAYERSYALYMQGLRWEDTRRLGTGRTTVPTFTFLPIPQQECLANPSRPCS